MQQTILITGATGFLGSHILEHFVKQDYNLIILIRIGSETSAIDHLLPQVKVYNIENLNTQNVFSMEKIDIIINTVCNYGRANESLVEIANTNLIFGLNLLEQAICYGVKTFINTDTLLPRNLNDYSLSKAQFSEWLNHLSQKIQVINLKIEHMYGPGDKKNKFVSWLINEMLNKTDEIQLTSGVQKRDFIYISDVVSAYDVVIKNRKELPNWSQFDIGTNTFTEVKKFVMLIAKELEKRNNMEISPRLKFGALAYRKGEVMVTTIDNSKLIEMGWKPKVNIYEGINKILNV